MSEPIDHRACLSLLALLSAAVLLGACGDSATADGPATADVVADVVADTTASDTTASDDAASDTASTDGTGQPAPSEDTATSEDATTTDDPATLPTEFEPGVELFQCLTDWPKVRNFRVANALGDVEASLAVANGEVDGPYPPGTILQLVPFEAMVKRLPGWSPTSADWEFFFLDASGESTIIVDRGVEEVFNSLGGNCFDCHAAAADHDFVCESGFGCVELPFTPELIADFQEADPRCDE